MAGQKISLMSHKNAILWLVGFTVCYQVVYQAFMYRTLRREALDEECHAPAVGSGLAAPSPQCAEVQLFRSWQEKEAELNSLAAEEPGESEEEHLVKESAPVKHFGEKASGVHNEPLPLLWTSDATATDGPSPASSGRASSLDTAHGAIAAIVEATAAATAAAATHSGKAGQSKLHGVLSSAPSVEQSATNRSEGKLWSPVTAWAQGLEDLQHRLEVHMEQLPSMHHKHAHERHEQLESLMDAVAASLNSSRTNAMTPWAEELVELQQHLDEGIKSRHHHEHSSQAPSTTTEVSLLERIYRVGKEMCMTPDHRDRPECAQFLTGEHGAGAKSASTHSLAHRPGGTSGHKANLSEEVEMQHVRLEKRLAELQADRKAWEEVFVAKVKGDSAVLGQTTQATPGTVAELPRTALRKGRVYVHWSSVTAWHGPRWWENSAGLPTVTREQAQGAHWSGMIPKVACITTISSGIHATVQMRYFIDNFHLQSYEGPRQLVLVYHYNDKKAAQLVQKYADGVSIRGVAARNEEAFPSTTGLRYGAWITDADVIARWDFDEWHHPNRLSLQVRALALSARPACLLQGDEAEDLPRESSVVGESAWMRRHWRPLAANESLILEGAQAERVVELRATGLRHGGHKTPSTTLSVNSSHKEREATSWSPTCSRVLKAQPTIEVHSSLEGSIGAKVGQEMEEMYRGLAVRRRDAVQKLRSLCVELAAESDQQRQERLDSDVERMSAIIGELDKHFATLNSLFSNGKNEAGAQA
mmetsp:Transcript_3542/g.8249  ORF Transcript_3542/g.8249 Transcript_3542/m.8249 type:complete len:759 (+) Transcript_3542:115-2391(+)|eukprot:CAMPEP_0171074806 /NCGR_PEP_ID=MMETSP0766_2-20121228/12374_1 /TAXON_ID=439317 /ORGANISM="Gambierdiscus australes, Strain CAWD 149" /LENGTH=758 /DNA_ID=CAMNT_0011531623 /DNA_START=145 /DNA_END=2421 /DNA_ORIENTATION=+